LPNLISLFVLFNETKYKYIQLSSEEESRQRIKELTQSIQNVRQEKLTELGRRAEVIAYQKDQLQEAKAKAQLEITYEKKKCENHLEQVRERCFIAEQDMRREQDVRNSHIIFSFQLKFIVLVIRKSL
jgi:hypothetical protein